MAEDEKDRAESGDFLVMLRWLSGIDSQAELARRTGIDRSEINKIEQGRQKPQAATWQKITTRIGVPQRLVGFLRWCRELIRKAEATAQRIDAPPSQASLPEDLRAAVWDAVERALALARAEHALLRSRPMPDPASPPTEQDHQRVEALLQKLMSYPEARQRLLIQGARAYRDPLLCLRLCKESEEVAPHDPAKALKLAESALFIARHLPPSAFRSRLESWCTGFIGNAQRVAGTDLPGTERTFAQVWRLWRAGEDPAGLFSQAYLLDMEASLRRDQGLFPRALKLHTDALALARPEEVGIILMNQAVTRKESGDPEGALRSLERAAQVIDGDRQPRHRWVLRFNQGSNLLVLDRAQEAEPIVEEVRRLAERLCNDTDLIRTLWLEANLAAGLGRKEEALAKLEQVRHEFEVRGNPFDYALASLDVALLYREEGRFPEIRVLADEILKIFTAQKVQREALAAVMLFQEAAEKETVTAEMVRRLKDYLAKARRSPGLRF